MSEISLSDQKMATLWGFLGSSELPWIKFDKQLGKIIIVVDNHLLSTYRSCAQHYMYQAVDGYQQKPQIGTAENDRKWYLDFGIVFHKMLQTYYSEFRLPDFNLAEWAFTLGYKY